MNYRLRDVLLDFCVRDHMDAEDAAFEIESLLAAHGETAPWMLNLLGSHDTPRLLTLCGGDERRAILALTALLTLPGAPMLYYGDEIGLEGENDPDCRRCLSWDERDWRQVILAATRRLIQLRRERPALRLGDWASILCFNGVLAYRRWVNEDTVMVVLNPRQAQRDLVLPLAAGGSTTWRDALSGATFPVNGDGLRIERLDACSALVLVEERDQTR
jgi:glycosidase